MVRLKGQSSDRMVLVVACLAQLMVTLDVTVVNVALPSIGHDLHYSATGLQWVVNAYVLTFAGFLLLGGRAADLFGRRKVYLFGVVLFTGASLAGGLAQTSGWLTAARAAQGVGAAFLSPTTLTILLTTFSGRRRARALGLWAAMGGVGGSVGVILGGVLTTELSWRWILFINLPIGVVAIIGALACLTTTHDVRTNQPLDVAGAVTITAGLAALAYAIVGTDQYPWGSTRTLAILAIAIVLLGLFVVLQMKGKNPLVPLRLFRSRTLAGANLVVLFLGSISFALWYFLSLYLQNILGFSPLRTGLGFIPSTIALVIGAQTSSRVITRIGARPLVLLGNLLATGGFVWLSQIGPGDSYWTHVFGASALTALGIGLVFMPLTATATSGVSAGESGLASGVLNTSRQVGGSIGLATLATVASSYSHQLVQSGAPLAAALTSGYARAYSVAAGLCLLSLVTALVVMTPRKVRGSLGQSGGLAPALPTPSAGAVGSPEPVESVERPPLAVTES